MDFDMSSIMPILTFEFVLNSESQFPRSLRMSGSRKDISHLFLNRRKLTWTMWMLFLTKEQYVFFIFSQLFEYIYICLLNSRFTGLSKSRCGETRRAAKHTIDHECIWAYLNFSGSQPQFTFRKTYGAFCTLCKCLFTPNLYKFGLFTSTTIYSITGPCQTGNKIYI